MQSAAIILCGGRSSRMGRPKAWLPWEGQPLVVYLSNRLSRWVDEVIVVSSETLPLPKDLKARVVVDREAHLGPLAGIAEGLEAMSAERAFVTATDAPFLTEAFVTSVLAAADAAAPSQDGFVQTLAAVYPKRAAAIARELLEAGSRRPLDLLEALDFRALAAGDLPALPEIRGMNSAEEYLAAVKRQQPGATAWAEFFGRARLATGTRQRERPIAKLGEFLQDIAPELPWIEEGRLRTEYLVSLEGRDFVRNPEMPLGPGEHVIILDAPTGG